jgi:hypothetical protein
MSHKPKEESQEENVETLPTAPDRRLKELQTVASTAFIIARNGSAGSQGRPSK